MGTDIHCWVEKRIEGKWHLVPPMKGEPGYNMWADEALEEAKARGDSGSENWGRERLLDLDLGRCYSLFGMLADVRNGSGFAGCDLGDGFKPILSDTKMTPGHRRGWPKDVCAELQGEDVEHSSSWLTLHELYCYDWHGQTTTMRGVISMPQYAKWVSVSEKHRGAPDSWCDDISGPQVEVIDMEEAGKRLKMGLFKPEDWKPTAFGHEARDPEMMHTHVRVSWQSTYAHEAAHFVGVIVSLMRVADREGVSPDDLRIVFYFDS